MKSPSLSQTPTRGRKTTRAPQSVELLAGETPTIKHVARLAGTGVATASRALGGVGSVAAPTRERVLQAARELGFSPDPNARRLVRGKCENTVGLFSTILDLGVGTRKLQIIQDSLAARGFQTPIYAYRAVAATPESQTALVAALCRQRYSGIVVGTASGLQAGALRELETFIAGGGVVSAFTYGAFLPLECDQIALDMAGNIEMATQFLIENGHRDLGFFWAGDSNPPPTRWAGFERALQNAGLNLRPEWILRGQGVAEHDLDGFHAAQGFLALPKNHRPSGMVIVNDLAALAFCATLRENGVRVPEELSVVSHDDKPLARFAAPPLSTVAHPAEEIARRVVENLLDRLENGFDGPPRKQKINGTLVKRNSVAPR